jgi:hypothetical protein
MPGQYPQKRSLKMEPIIVTNAVIKVATSMIGSAMQI